MVVKASYDIVNDFSEGLAVVGMSREEEGMAYSIIDKKGNTVFKIKDGQSPKGYGFNGGYLIVNDGDRDILYNAKGEITKFPSKIARISQTDGKFVIFENEDRESGVADMEGEIIIRPKYPNVIFNGPDSSDGFIAWDDDESIILNTKGDLVNKLDYKNVTPFGDFGYFAGDGNRICQIDDKGKSICKEDFYYINLQQRALCYAVESDFFDTAAVAKTVAGLVNGGKVGEYALGMKPSAVLKGESPSDYTYRNQLSLDQLSKQGYRYRIEAEGYFNGYMALSEWNSFDYSYDYQWNPESRLAMIRIAVQADTEWGKTGFDALLSAFNKEGFKTAKEGHSEGNAYSAMLLKGDVAVLVTCEAKEDTGYVVVFDKKLDGMSEFYNQLLGDISTAPGNSPSEEAIVEADSTDWANTEAVEEVIAAEEAPAEAAW